MTELEQAPTSANTAPSEARSQRWTIKDALLAYLVATTLPVAVSIVLFYAGVRISIGLGTLLLDAMVVATMLHFSRRRSSVGLRDLGVRRTHARAAVGWVLLGLFASGVFSSVYAVVFHPAAARDPFQAAHARGALAVTVLGLGAVLSAPVVEELFFRGFIYRAFRNSIPILPAVLVNGVLFGAVHALSQHLAVLPELAFIGCIACLLYERTGSLLPAIALHSYIDSSGFEFAVRHGQAGISFFCFLILALVFLLAPWRWHLRAGPKPA